MEIICYPHPTLRRPSSPIRRVDRELKETVREMFALMYEANGVGLAANQVNLPLRLFVANLEANPDEGEEMVFINPVISRPKARDEAEEGCLSIPGIYGQVTRPRQITVTAYDLEGRELSATMDGLFARVIQHETDHLDGILFPDRMTESALSAMRPALDEMEVDFESRRRTGQVPDNAAIEAELKEWESRYC